MSQTKCVWMGLGIALAMLAGCSSEPAMVRQLRKERLIDTIRQKLLESAEAEKSAVLATTDEESQAAAREATHLGAEVNTARGELRQLIAADGRRDEIDKLNAFDAAWADVERVDERLLALAVANTNLKAAKLLSRDGAAALDRFVGSLMEMQRAATDPDVLRTLSSAAVAALRSQALLFAHIPSADDAEMARLEQQMQDLNADVDRSLSSVRASGQAEGLAAASAAWDEYRRLAVEVIRLSRENSNVISFDVSVHEKRQVTKQALAALSALSAVVSSNSYGTR
jgi:hypothetical protein